MKHTGHVYVRERKSSWLSGISATGSDEYYLV